MNITYTASLGAQIDQWLRVDATIQGDRTLVVVEDMDTVRTIDVSTEMLGDINIKGVAALFQLERVIVFEVACGLLVKLHASRAALSAIIGND